MGLEELYQFFRLFGKITIGTLLIPISIAFWYYRVLLRPLKFFLTFLVTIFCLEMLVQFFIWYATYYYEQIKDILIYWNISDTNFLGIFFHLASIYFLGNFYRLIIEEKIRKKILLVTYGLMIAIIINYLFIEGYNTYGVFAPNVVNVFLICLSVLHLYLVSSQSTFPVKRNPYYWISVAILISNLAGIMLNFIGDVTYEENYALFIVMTTGNNFFSIIRYLLFGIAFYHASYAKYLYPYNR